MKNILGIETSCDETACAIVNTNGDILSNIVYSQIDMHSKFGGVVPELASRDHAAKLGFVFDDALKAANIIIDDIDAVAVTNGPGLLGCLLVGISFAKAISYVKKIPLIPVDHIKAHLLSIFIDKKITMPFMGLVVSGGHTSIYLVKSFEDIELISSTVDDAAGECFDKVSRFLGFSYPGGRVISEKAKGGDYNYLKFKIPIVKDKKYAFSFSGLKTAMINYINSKNYSPEKLNDVLASFEYTVCQILVNNLINSSIDRNVKNVVISGGVAANLRLRQMLSELANKNKINHYLVPTEFCGDNAVMIANYGKIYFNKFSKYNNDVLSLKPFVTSRR